ncbi:activator-dependent family glycosyltransferase [Streptomyces halobius]|uniref:Activator-dependent family glycosyltransferase n=1 Tax=Streptomyces halobius TaxID=2879846 RepID=A0ABY4MI08_9ACTN|nr:activator-dependent family glycosyltransferase [Streptomyces halobius]UQA97332.1 activator-dependent family glycosyltransferase [Streptomyces halobius]
MRVLFTTHTAKSHLFAQVTLAWALRAAGHEVHVAGQPDLADDITGTGLTAVTAGAALDLAAQLESYEQYDGPGGSGAAGESGGSGAYAAQAPEAWDEAGGADDYRAMAERFEYWTDMTEIRPEKLSYEYMHGVFTAMTTHVFQQYSAPAMVDDLVCHARWWRPDLVVWDPLTFAGPIAARASGAVHVRLLFGLDLIGRMRESYLDAVRRLPPGQREDPMEEWLGWTMRRYGGEFGEDLVVGQRTIDPLPGSLRFPVGLDRVPMRFVTHNGSSVFPDWLREPPKRRRICLTLGVSHRDLLGADRVPLREVLAAVAGADVEVVATLNKAQLASVTEVPDNIRVMDFVPLEALLPSCSVVIHHGGAGTFNTALSCGVPQLILPDGVWDTDHKARLLEERGAGLRVAEPERADAGMLRVMLTRLLEERSFADAAARLRQESRDMPAPSAVVPVLEELAEANRRGAGAEPVQI